MENTQNNINQKNTDILTIEFIIWLLRSNIPIITLYVYLIGIIHILSYYAFWGIDIIKYISISETLIAPIQYIVFIFMFSILLIFSFFVSSKIAKKPVGIFYDIPNIVANNRVFPFLVLCMIILTLIFNIFDYNRNGISIIDGWSIYIYSLCIIRVAIVRKKNEFITFIKYMFIITALLVLFKSMQDFYNCRSYLGKKENISFQYKGKTYTETDSLFSIGQTAQYIFMYNKPKDKILVFPISQLSDIEIKKYIDTK